MTPNIDSLNGVRDVSLNGNGISIRNRDHGEETLGNGTSNGDHGEVGSGANGSIRENPSQNGHVNSNGNHLTRPKIDEYDVDFTDTRKFAVKRWEDIASLAASRLSVEDRKAASEFLYWHDVGSEIEARLRDPSSTQLMKRHMGRITTFPNILAKLTMVFDKLVFPSEVKFDILWGLVYLNLKMSYSSLDRLKRTCDIFHKMRRVTELFNRCLEECDQPNEARFAIVDFLDPLVQIVSDCISHYHEHTSERDASEAWPILWENTIQLLQTLDSAVKHVSDISNFSKVNKDRQVKSLSSRHAQLPDVEEPGVFPNRILPFQRNRKFYGRKEELDKILKYLKPATEEAETPSFRTYTIYGRRGVGKTEIALQFAHTNPGNYDAIFWVQCETSVAIRQSFTNVALSLNLPGAAKDGHHEENLVAVRKWLKTTKKKWLLIFDNAESDQIIRPYWPVGAMGAILITSRRYYNFAKDEERKGDTVKQFTARQSWELLLELLGDEWKKADKEGTIPQSEIIAAKSMLEQLEGLALAIQQAAIMIKNPNIGGPTIAKTYERFKERMKTLPPRHSSPRSASEVPLDALWDMTFSSLGPHARTLLGVFSWLSPDSIPADLFLPRDQSALNGSLAFCKQEQIDIHHPTRLSIVNALTHSPAFEEAIKELLDRELIKRDNRVYSIHRVVQEATNYHDEEDLQDSFNIASRLTYEAFPKKIDQPLFKQWAICQTYIPHGVFLSKKFSAHTKYGKLKSTLPFIKLLNACAWYLYETADFEVCKKVVETAVSTSVDTSVDRNSLLYAEIMNTAGSRYYDLNQLVDCRTAWEETLRIRKELLLHDDKQMAAIYNNFGNLELATGNPKWAMENYEKAIQIWNAAGDDAADQLALTHLCLGRVHTLQQNIREALKSTSLAETLFLHTTGADKGFMANVHYAYGNIYMKQDDLSLAWRSYDECLKIGLGTMPLHPITAAAYYSLGCVEFARGNYDPAKSWLDKARTIAELNSPMRDDGTIARIIWKTSQVLQAKANEQGPKQAEYEEQAETLLKRATIARAKLLRSGEGGSRGFLGDEDEDEEDEEEDYNILVPLFFR